MGDELETCILCRGWIDEETCWCVKDLDFDLPYNLNWDDDNELSQDIQE